MLFNKYKNTIAPTELVDSTGNGSDLHYEGAGFESQPGPLLS
jgi:hypothetical protein